MERDSANEPSAGRAKALAAAAKLAAHFGADVDAQAYATAYLQLPVVVRNPSSEGLAHNALGIVAMHAGDLVGARDHIETATRLSHEVGEGAASIYLSYLGAIAAAEGDLDEAQHVYERCLAEARADDFFLAIGLALEGLASVARLRGNAARAQVLYEEAIHTLGPTLNMPQVVSMLIALGDLALDKRDPTTARRRFAEALQCAEGLGHRQALAAVLEGGARLILNIDSSGRARLEEAVRAFGAAAALGASTGRQPGLEDARRRLVRGRLNTLLQEGRALPLDQAVGLARTLVSEQRASAGRDTERGSALTPREREVASLVARGWSNRQIAEALVLGERTVEMHVSHTLSKLGFSSRSQVAVWATRNADADQALASI
jgi:DNA-binding NarL/FixJ family response regulator